MSTVTPYPDQWYKHTHSVFDHFREKKIAETTADAKNLQSPNNKENKDTAKKKNLNKGALIACAVGGGMLFMSKGVQKHTSNALQKIKTHLEGKLDISMLESSHRKISFYEYSLRKVNSILLKSESINNINSLKDILFMKTMYKTSPTRKIHKGISKLFERLSINTVKKSYKKTQKSFDNMYKTFDDLDNYILKTAGDEVIEYKGEKLTKREFVERAKDHRDTVKLVVNAFISDGTQEARYKCIKDATTKLYSDFWEESFKGFWSKDNKFKNKEMWQTFIAAEQIKKNKTALAENVSFARNMLSYTSEEKRVFLSTYLKNLDAIIPPTDVEGADIMKRLNWFISDPKALKDNQDIFLKELSKLEKHKITDDKNLLRDKETNIRLIRNMVSDNGTGELQDMLDIYYRIAPFELSKSGALKTAKDAVSSFDKSVNLEIGEFFDKARDLGLGSAPTDILTMLLSCGMITFGLNRAKGKDEKTSVMLKSGIPLVGGVATSLISATKLVSGGKSIALGLASGLVLNQLGKFTDDYRKSKNLGTDKNTTITR